ncbi:MAG: prepilin-type N-terminal cleavage/methylation domain-containing protein [Anaerolineaceae bacterium]|nr:prepilin-type N-terminal cleavage/methylation domain-containing protein [Anaerolineaceae bacterium]
MKRTLCLRGQFLRGRSRRPVRRRGFTLVELLMGMMVSSLILASVATLSWTIGSYNGQGEATVDLSRQALFGMDFLERDLRAARVAGVTDGGSLVLWMGDLNENGTVDMEEIIIYQLVADEGVVERLTFTGGTAMAAITPAGLTSIMQAQDFGLIEWAGSTFGYTTSRNVICNDVDTLNFYPKRVFPDTASVEFALELSRPENVITGGGETVYLSLYGTGTLRAPFIENGFYSQF